MSIELNKYKYIECIIMYLTMFTRKQKFSEFLEECSCSSLYTSEEISEMIALYTSPCPSVSGALRQRYYRVRKNYVVKHSNSTNILYKATSPNLLKVVPKNELFNLFETVHSDDGKHLGRDRLFTELKKQFAGFSRKIVLKFVGMCPECQLQKSKKSLKSTVTKPIRSSDFASRGQVDLIDMQTSRAMNEPYNFLLVYQDHLTKFIVLRPLKRKTAAEVTSILLDIFCLIGPPHILQSDNGKEFKNIDLAKMIRELWPGCKTVNGRPRHPQSQGSVERVNKEIKKVLGALMRKNNDPCWVKYVPIAQHSINTCPHSTLENYSPYRVLFGREPTKGLAALGIPDNIASDLTTEEELNM